MTPQLSKFTLLFIASQALLAGCSTTAKVENPELAERVWADMVRVEGGSFEMGSDSADAKDFERPAHQVTLDGFYLSRFEVTVSLYESLMGPSNSYFAGEDVPINNISWSQANTFIERLNAQTGKNYRLPTEAEWEYAANGGAKAKDTLYAGSNDIDAVAWYGGNANNRAHPVGQKAPNELGLYDMTGNIGEFCQDIFSENFYRYSPGENPFNAETDENRPKLKTVRGGSFAYDADESENFRRDFASHNVLMGDMGFRLAHDAD